MMDSGSTNQRADQPGNIRELLEQRAHETPDKPFLFSEADGRQFTYAEFDLAVNRAASMLISWSGS